MSAADAPGGLIHALLLDGKGGASALPWREVLEWTPDRGCLWLLFNFEDAEAAAWLANAAALVERRGRPIPLTDGAGERVLTAVWSLFLKPHFQFERWTVVVGIPQSVAFQAIRTFERIFAGVALVALLVAFLFGRRLIRSNLEPLDRLSEATGHLAAGEFAHRVELRSGDEFEQLGDAFNGMAARIGEQFDTLETLARLDRELQLADDVAAALTAAGDAADALVGPGRAAFVCLENWQDRRRSWCRGFDRQRVVTCEPPAGLSLQDRLDPQLLRQLGATTFDDLSVVPISDTDQVVAGMVIRDAAGADIDSARRIADVLGIALSNLVMEQRLFYQANHDWLSDLPNRSYLHHRFSQLTADGAASTSIGMLLIGLDRFKQVNDSLGHAGGDRLLAEIARLSREHNDANVLALGGRTTKADVGWGVGVRSYDTVAASPWAADGTPTSLLACHQDQVVAVGAGCKGLEGPSRLRVGDPVTEP